MFDKQADLSASTIAVFAQTESKIQYFGISNKLKVKKI
jgi:hypothetical protein